MARCGKDKTEELRDARKIKAPNSESAERALMLRNTRHALFTFMPYHIPLKMAETAVQIGDGFYQDKKLKRDAHFDKIDDLLARYLNLVHEYEQTRAQLSETLSSVRLHGTSLNPI